MIVADSSVLIAGFMTWHEAHARARDLLRRRPRLIAHCALETYSVLTRLPYPHRAPGDLVVEFLQSRFPDPPLAPSDGTVRTLLASLQQAGILGGAVYDGLVALTAADHDAHLYTLDRRAEATYRRCGIEYTLISG